MPERRSPGERAGRRTGGRRGSGQLASARSAIRARASDRRLRSVGRAPHRSPAGWLLRELHRSFADRRRIRAERRDAMNDTILVADDEPLARRTLRTQLRDLGCRGTIHEAGDGESAVAMANRERPDLIFLDIVMPGATGLQVLERLD